MGTRAGPLCGRRSVRTLDGSLGDHRAVSHRHDGLGAGRVPGQVPSVAQGTRSGRALSDDNLLRQVFGESAAQSGQLRFVARPRLARGIGRQRRAQAVASLMREAGWPTSVDAGASHNPPRPAGRRGCQWQPKTAHIWQLKTAHLCRSGRGLAVRLGHDQRDNGQRLYYEARKSRVPTTTGWFMLNVYLFVPASGLVTVIEPGKPVREAA